jgi:hypothetical protein
MNPRRTHGEEGSALVIALVFLTVIGLITAGLLSFMDVAFHTTVAVRDQRAQAYSVDGAAKAAIQRIRGTLSEGVDPADGGTCSPDTPTIDGRTVTVTCVGQPGSGHKTLFNGDANTPRYAILTMSQEATEDGINQNSNAELKIGGPVFSNSNIVGGAEKAVLAVDGAVYALGNCDPTKVTTTDPPLHCANAAHDADPADGVDPAYPSPLTAVPPVQAVPACPGGWLVTLTPGTYDDANALSALTNGSCAGRVVLFQPGIYYLNSTNGDVWSINDANGAVIGGTPSGWDPAAATKPTIPVGEACDLTQAGVTFVIGGTTRLDVQAGGLELCPTPSNTSQQFSIYGVPSSTTPSTPVSLTADPASASGAYSPATGALVAGDGTTASATVVKNSSATMTLSSFGTITVPANATVTRVELLVRHQDTNISGNSVTATAGWLPGSAPVSVNNLRATLYEDAADITTQVAPGTTTFTSPTVTFTARSQGGNFPTRTSVLDGVRLQVTYTTPALEGLGGCLTVSPYPGGGACPLIHTDGAQTQLYLHGTVYAPTAPVDINLTNVSGQAFSRGLISRVAILQITPASTYDGAVIGLPGASPGGTADRTVLFTARLCPVGTSSCPPASGTGTDRLRVLVVYVDGNGATPGAAVQLKQWSVLR